MNLGTTLASVEKKFGPALAGVGGEGCTFSATRFAAGKGKKFAGIPGKRDDAVFYVHFPVPVDWSQLTTKKGTPDFINNLSASGPQGEQGRELLVEQFLANYEKTEASRRAKGIAKEKKRLAAEKKEASRFLREKLAQFEGERTLLVEIDGERLEIPVSIKIAKTGKVKLTGEF